MISALLVKEKYPMLPVLEKMSWRIRNHINHIDFISVREKSSVYTLRPFTSKRIFHVLDPTLLLERNTWEILAKTKKKRKPYLLVYRVSGNEDVFKIAGNIGRRLNLEVVYINNHKPAIAGIKNIRRVGPRDFITLFRDASFIVTNSFHGTTFSVLFNKDFVTVPHEKRGSRMIDLLHLLKLEDRIITNTDQIGEGYRLQVDYLIPNKILNIERKRSIMFLQRAIEGITE